MMYHGHRNHSGKVKLMPIPWQAQRVRTLRQHLEDRVVYLRQPRQRSCSFRKQIITRARTKPCDFEDNCLEERRDGGTGQEERKVLIDRQMEGRHAPGVKHKYCQYITPSLGPRKVNG